MTYQFSMSWMLVVDRSLVSSSSWIIPITLNLNQGGYLYSNIGRSMDYTTELYYNSESESDRENHAHQYSEIIFMILVYS